MSSAHTSGLVQSSWVRYAHVACAVFVVYEHFLQFDNEVEHFWKRRWTLGKILFLWCRYFSIILNLTDAIIFLQPKPSHEVYVPLLAPATFMLRWRAVWSIQGRQFFHWQNFGAASQVMVTHLILQLRLFAMYESTRKMLIFFICLTVAEVVILGVNGALGLQDPQRITTEEPFPGVFVCANGEPSGAKRWTVYYFVEIIIVEGIMVFLALRKAWQYRPSVCNFTLMQKLTRDSAMYFLIIFSIYLANLVIWAVNRITLNELGVPFAFAISSVFANRLLIAVRVAHYGDNLSTNMDPSSLRFIHDLSTSTSSWQERVELRTFNERIGT